MSQQEKGPAAGTRSKNISNTNGSVYVSAEKSERIKQKAKKTKEVNPKHTQTLLSDYLIESHSDSELIVHSKRTLKKRSVSGKIYKTATTLQIGEESGSQTSTASVNRLPKLSEARIPTTHPTVSTTTRESDAFALKPKTNMQSAIELTQLDSNAGSNSAINTSASTASNQMSVYTTANPTYTSPTGTCTSSSSSTNQLPLFNSVLQPNFNNLATINTLQPFYSSTAMGASNMFGYYPNHTTGATNVTPASTDTNMILQMLQRMDTRLGIIQTDVQSLKNSKLEVSEQIHGLQYEQQECQDTLDQHQTDLTAYKDKVDILGAVSSNYELRFKAIEDKLTNIEAKAMRPNLIVKGIKEDSEQTPAQQSQNFFKEQLQLDPPPKVATARRIGTGKEKPLLVTLVTPLDKAKIYTNTKNLKGVTNADKKSYHINDQLPEAYNEDQMRHRQIVAANKRLPDGHQKSVVLKKGKLTINQVEYKKKVQPLQLRDMLNMGRDELKELHLMKIFGGYERSEAGSRFLVFASAAKNLADIRKFYNHMKLRFASASHVVLTYRLEGFNKAYDEDYQDDGEYGMGRRILTRLLQEDMEGIAVCVIRFYGGQHIGPKRFEIALDLLQKTLADYRVGLTINSKLPYTAPPTKSQTAIKQRTRSYLPRFMAPSMTVNMGPAMTSPNLQHRSPMAFQHPTMAFNRYQSLNINDASPTADEDSEAPTSELEVSPDRRAKNRSTWSDMDTDTDERTTNLQERPASTL